MSSKAVTAWTVSLAVCFCQPQVNSKLLHMQGRQYLCSNPVLKGQSTAEGHHTARQAPAEKRACQPNEERGGLLLKCGLLLKGSLQLQRQPTDGGQTTAGLQLQGHPTAVLYPTASRALSVQSRVSNTSPKVMCCS